MTPILLVMNALATPPDFYRTNGAVLASGDIDGDGYDDVLFTNNEATFLHRGSATGLDATTVSWMIPTYLRYVAVGDINADGFDDLLALLTDDDELQLYLGSATGLSTSPDWTHRSDAYTHPHLVDFDGDGFLEAVVPRPRSTGHIPVFAGSATGLSTEPTYQLSHDFDSFDGWMLSSGDVDGDGYQDLLAASDHANTDSIVVYGGPSGPDTDLVGAPRLPSNVSYDDLPVLIPDVDGDGTADALFASPDGVVVVFGSATGLDPLGGNTSAGLPLDLPFSDRYLYTATAVVHTLDADLDGDEDLLLSVDQVNVGTVDEGMLLLYEQGPTGLTPEPVWTAEGQTYERRLEVVLVADVDGDGSAEAHVSGGVQVWRHRAYEASSAGLPGGMVEGTWRNPTPLVEIGPGIGGVDLDGDGHTEVIVGESDIENEDWDQDSFFHVFRGQVTGLESTPTHSLAYSNSGQRVQALGDIDSDGFDDVLLGRHRRMVEATSGPCWLYNNYYGYYYSSEAGFECPYAHTAVSVLWGSVDLDADTDLREGRNFFHLMGAANAGDVDGDGHVDLLAFDGQGRVGLWYGVGDGTFSTEADWTLAVGDAEMSWANRLAGLGDIDGDGFDDFAVGEPGWPTFGAEAGRVRVFRGGLLGPELHQDWSGAGIAGLGLSVAGADVNGDGFDDLLLGSVLDGGRVHLGSAVGLDPVAAWEVPLEDAEPHGYHLASAGDVNDDGLDDVIVRPSGPRVDAMHLYFEGAGDYDGPESVRVFLGAATGLEGSAIWRMDEGWGAGSGAASVGDIDGDGQDDIGLTGSERLVIVYGSEITDGVGPAPATGHTGDTGLTPTTPTGSTGDTSAPTDTGTTEPVPKTGSTTEPSASGGGGEEEGCGCTTEGAPSWWSLLERRR